MRRAFRRRWLVVKKYDSGHTASALTRKRSALTIGSMRVWLVLFVISLLSCVGCKKQEVPASLSSTDSVSDPSAPSSPRGPVRVAASDTNSAVVIRETSDPNATLQQLTGALRDYVVRTRTVPKNFDEFVTKGQITVPPPPAGQKYALQGQAVVLVQK
jgi:cell division protein FtsN